MGQKGPGAAGVRPLSRVRFRRFAAGRPQQKFFILMLHLSLVTSDIHTQGARNEEEPMEGNSRTPYTSDVVDPLWRRVLNERFTILEPIGSGGMGRVYRAIQSPLDRIVALKVLNPLYANGTSSEFRKRFFLEASLTSRLHHPNTITVIDYGHTPDGIFYIAMEYLEGQTLSQLLYKSGAMHWTRCLVIADQICRSLREAHRLHVIHRDLKPSNVMLLSNYPEADMVKVLDFGLVKSFLAKDEGALELESPAPTARYIGNGHGHGNGKGDSAITHGGMFLGSPQYMAPEQANNQADHRSDIYSLGATLYHMIAGRPPFWGKDSVEVILKHLYEPVPRMAAVRPDLSIPSEVEALVMRCLEKDPSQRFPSMDAVLEAIRQPTITAASRAPVIEPAAPLPGFHPTHPLETTRTVKIPAPSSGYTASLPLWRARGAWTFASAALTLLFVLGFVLWRGRANAPASVPVTPPITQASAPIPIEGLPAIPSATSLPAEETLAKPKTVRFVVASEPAGATLSYDGRVLGVTPVSFDLPADAEGRAKAELTFSLKGYHPMVVVAGGSNEIALTQRLQAQASSREESGSIARRVAEEAPSVPVPLPEPKKPPPAIPTPAPEAKEPKLALGGPAPMPSPDPGRVPPGGAVAQENVQQGPVEFNDRMTLPRKISGPDPKYTDKALGHEVEGTMEARCIITVEGTVHGCRVVKSVLFMDRAVINALELRRYTPARLDGKPVEIYYTFKTMLKLPN